MVGQTNFYLLPSAFPWNVFLMAASNLDSDGVGLRCGDLKLRTWNLLVTARASSRPRPLHGIMRKNVVKLHSKRPCQKHNFAVGHATVLSLNLGDNIFANVPSNSVASGREHRLSPTFLESDALNCRPDNVFWRRHSRCWPGILGIGGDVFLPILEENGISSCVAPAAFYSPCS